MMKTYKFIAFGLAIACLYPRQVAGVDVGGMTFTNGTMTFPDQSLQTTVAITNNATDPIVLKSNLNVGGRIIAGTYPIFRIDMGTYVEFQVKASTNFNNNTFIYWYASRTAPGWTTNRDMFAKVYFTGSSEANPHKWIFKDKAHGIHKYLQNVNSLISAVIFCPSHTISNTAVATEETIIWMTPTNQNLTWVYLRHSLTSPENTGLGDLIWRPMTPVSWENAQPNYPQ